MTVGEYLAEWLEHDVEALIQASIGAALDLVEAEWSATDALTLPEPANYDRGYRTFMLDKASTEYPYVLTMFPTRTSGKIEGEQLQQSTYQGTISIFIVGSTEAIADKIAKRYAQAVISILQSQQTIRGCTLRDWKPSVEILADSATHLVAGNEGDTYNPNDVDYMRLVDITLAYEDL